MKPIRPLLFLLFGYLFSISSFSHPRHFRLLASKENEMACFGGEDKDGDGVKDADDLCPDVKGKKQNSGCPDITVEIWTSFYIALSDVNFKINSDSITPSSYPSLEKVADLMKANKGFILKLGGYTDSTGSKEHNKQLAEDRAKSVKRYLVEKEHVNAKRIRLASYGEKMPKAPNTTASGRAINRRVEFDLFY